MPTFKIYMDGDNVATVQGGDEPKLRSLITRYTKQLQVHINYHTKRRVYADVINYIY